MPSERLRPLPVNALAPPTGLRGDLLRNTGTDTHRVLARLVWPGRRVHVVPAEVRATAKDRVLVAWWPTTRSREPRKVWLAHADVKPRLEWRT